jgi:hypothetical protein
VNGRQRGFSGDVEWHQDHPFSQHRSSLHEPWSSPHSMVLL